MKLKKQLIALVNGLLLAAIIYGCYIREFKDGSTDKSILLPLFYLFCLYMVNIIFFAVLRRLKIKELLTFQWIMLICLLVISGITITVFDRL